MFWVGRFWYVLVGFGFPGAGGRPGDELSGGINSRPATAAYAGPEPPGASCFYS